MIELHRTESDEYGEEIEQTLNEMVLAFRTELYTDAGSTDLPLPCICDSGRVISGESDIRNFLDTLERELRIQRSISGDGCYIDPDTGEVC
ncbi:MAG: hypothetical protein WD529_04925 [Balneolaceae bacterium]